MLVSLIDSEVRASVPLMFTNFGIGDTSECTMAGQNGVSRETTTGRRVNQSFTNAELAEDLVQHVFDIDTAGQSAKGPGGLTQLFGDQLLARTL